MDTLLLPSSGLKNATVRWVPGPGEITGVGYALLHCHISPHSDEGCIMKTQILEQKCVHPSLNPMPHTCLPHASHAEFSCTSTHASAMLCTEHSGKEIQGPALLE